MNFFMKKFTLLLVSVIGLGYNTMIFTADPGHSNLNAAAQSGNVELTRTLIDQGADLNLTDEYGVTPLYWAAAEEHDEIAQHLIADHNDRQSYLTMTDGYGRTPLHIAAEYGHYRVVRLIITFHHDPQAYVTMADHSRGTPLHNASYCDYHEVVQLLLAHHKDPQAYVTMIDERGRTPLHWAAKNGCNGVVQFLIAAHKDSQAYITMIDDCRRTPLDLAIKNGHNDTAELMSSWPQFIQGLKCSLLALTCAMHSRCGTNSPARRVDPIIVAHICSFLNAKTCVYKPSEVHKYIEQANSKKS